MLYFNYNKYIHYLPFLWVLYSYKIKWSFRSKDHRQTLKVFYIFLILPVSHRLPTNPFRQTQTNPILVDLQIPFIPQSSRSFRIGISSPLTRAVSLVSTAQLSLAESFVHQISLSLLYEKYSTWKNAYITVGPMLDCAFWIILHSTDYRILDCKKCLYFEIMPLPITCSLKSQNYE